MRKPLPPLKSIPVFASVAKNLNYAKASVELHVTVSAISQQIKLLEDDLGVNLFNRNAGGVTLTKAGAQYAERINTALGILQEATQQARQKPANDHTLTVHLMNTFAVNWLIPRLASFYLAAPQIDLQLSTHWKTADMNGDALQVLIGYGTPKQWPGLYVEKLISDHLVAVVQPALLRTLPESLEQQLTQTTWINTEDELRAQDWLLWLQAVGAMSPTPKKHLSVPSTLHGLQAARNGLGIFVTHQIFVQQDLEQGTLHMLTPIVAETPWAYYWVSPEQHLQSPTVQAFKQWITHTSKETS